LSLAEAPIQAAFRLRPDAGEAHLARAEHLYLGYRDFDGALVELELAHQSLSNDPRVLQLMGLIERRQGRWDESTRNLERAIDVDPRNNFLLLQTALSYYYLRRYPDHDALVERALAIDPKQIGLKLQRGLGEIDWKANTRPLHQLIEEVRAKEPGAIPRVAKSWLECALAEHNPVAASNALAAIGADSFGDATVKYGRHFMEGLVARMIKDDAKARVAFTAARADQDEVVRANPDDAGALCVLGLIDAALGRNEEALREGRRAVELLSVEKDAINGAHMIVVLANIAAWVGDKGLACEQLAHASHLPNGPTYGDLKLLPWWDPLRGDPCFEKIVASLAPK